MLYVRGGVEIWLLAVHEKILTASRESGTKADLNLGFAAKPLHSAETFKS